MIPNFLTISVKFRAFGITFGLTSLTISTKTWSVVESFSPAGNPKKVIYDDHGVRVSAF